MTHENDTVRILGLASLDRFCGLLITGPITMPCGYETRIEGKDRLCPNSGSCSKGYKECWIEKYEDVRGRTMSYEATTPDKSDPTAPASKRTRDRIAELERALRWIPVTERLPEGGYVLACAGNFIEIVTAQTFNWVVGGLYECKYTHWQALPAPPEEKP